MKKVFGAIALSLALLGGASAKAATFTVNDFETDLSGMPDQSQPATIGTFGVTSGTHSASYVNSFVSGPTGNLIDVGTVNGTPAGETAEQLREYQAINAASVALATGPVQLIFDLTYDASSLGTAGKGFFQFGPFINTDAGASPNAGGFQNGMEFGGLLGFDIGQGGTNPALATAAITAGDQLIDLQLLKTGIASNSVTGSLELVVNASSNANPGTIHLISGGTSFAQFGLGFNGNFGQVVDPTTFNTTFTPISLGIDNIRFVSVPEPATLGLLSMLVPALGMRRRKA